VGAIIFSLAFSPVAMLRFCGYKDEASEIPLVEFEGTGRGGLKGLALA